MTDCQQDELTDEDRIESARVWIERCRAALEQARQPDPAAPPVPLLSEPDTGEEGP